MRTFALVCLAFCALAIPGLSQAATPGSLIKGSGPSVYYLDQDLKRYIFPTEATYKTWYTDFSGVQTVSDAELMSYPLGANVTYRPGVRLVKITTDPRVYAVGRAGTLRWVETEAVARALYGEHWARMVDDIPDAFFVNYRVGASIRVVGDFSPASERDAVTYIGMNRNVTSPIPSSPPTPAPTSTTSTVPVPAPTPSPSSHRLLLELTPSAPRLGGSITLRAEAQPATANLLKLYFEGVLQHTCDYYLCSMSLDLPATSARGSFTALAEARWSTGETTSSTLVVTPQAGTPYISLAMPQDIEPGAQREVIATATNGFIARYIDIYLDGGVVRGCVDQQECRYTAPEAGAIGTLHSIYVIATDRNGQTARTETKTLEVVANDRPTLGIALGKERIFPGETVDVRVTAADGDGIRETQILIDGQVIKTCQLSVCDAVLGPWAVARTVEVVGRAQDQLGAFSFATSTTLTVQR